jgi:hypothetical protein
MFRSIVGIAFVTVVSVAPNARASDTAPFEPGETAGGSTSPLVPPSTTPSEAPTPGQPDPNGSSMATSAAAPLSTGDPQKDAVSPESEPRDVRSEIPNVAYAYTAFGATAKTMGAQAYGLGVGAAGQKSILGGGASVWGSPIDRLTIIGDGQRNAFGEFTPSAAVLARLFGERNNGWSLGAIGKFKIDGFAAGPTKDEVESEVEAGVLVSFARDRWHLDANAIGGQGLGDDGEADVEGRFRLSYDVAPFARIGIDSQARARVSGPRLLPNGRTWDAVGGAQLLMATNHFFGSLTTGPTTVGLVSDRIGWNALVSLGGSTF